MLDLPPVLTLAARQVTALISATPLTGRGAAESRGRGPQPRGVRPSSWRERPPCDTAPASRPQDAAPTRCAAGVVAQWISHRRAEQETVGSSPTSAIRGTLARRAVVAVAAVIINIFTAAARACRLRAGVAVHGRAPAAAPRHPEGHHRLQAAASKCWIAGCARAAHQVGPRHTAPPAVFSRGAARANLESQFPP